MELRNNDGIKTYMDENQTLYHSIEEYRTQPLKKQIEQKRNKRQLDSTTPPPPDGNSKKNKQDDDHNSTFSEGIESHSVSVLRDFFENQQEDPLQVNTEQNMNDLDKNKVNEKREENKEHQRNDIYLTQTPENVSYITELSW